MLFNLQSIKEGTKNILFFFWQRLALVFVIFVLIDLIIGALFFWQYYFRTQNGALMTPDGVSIEKNLASQLLEKWTERDQFFEQAPQKDRPDPFNH